MLLKAALDQIRAISADTMTALLCPEDALDKTVTILRVQDRAGFNAVGTKLFPRSLGLSVGSQIHGRLLQAKRLLQVPSALSSGDRTTRRSSLALLLCPRLIPSSLTVQAALENTKVHWLSTSLPFSCRTVFLDILETARRRFGIEVDVVKCLELDMSIRGPAGCTFETAATRYLVHGPSAASQAREALQSGVPARALSALETLEAARIDDHTVEQAVLKLARCSDLSVVLRLPALEALAMDSAEERWPVEDILDEYQNASLPIQQKLLPLAAGSLSSAAAPPTRVFDAIHLATGEQESVDTRMSAALAIRNLSPRIISFDRQVQVQIFEEIITLFQDDEEDIRDQVSDVVGGLLHDGLPVVPARGIELVLRHLRDHLGVNLADRLVQTDLSQGKNTMQGGECRADGCRRRRRTREPLYSSLRDGAGESLPRRSLGDSPHCLSRRRYDYGSASARIHQHRFEAATSLSRQHFTGHDVEALVVEDRNAGCGSVAPAPRRRQLGSPSSRAHHSAG